MKKCNHKDINNVVGMPDETNIQIALCKNFEWMFREKFLVKTDNSTYLTYFNQSYNSTFKV